ncbi:MAG: nuclear transport factor 2 family protein [Polyangiaceae bacterium]|jgi:predicted SnoaL-like aldol condensation-catalyzing enzyme
MSEVETARRLFERLKDCAEPEDFASLVGELDAGANRDASALAAGAEASRGVVRRYFEMWNTGDRTEADAVLGPTYLDHAHPSVVGPAAVRSLVRRFRAESPEARVVVEIVAFDSEYVIVRRAIRWSAQGAMEACGVALFRVVGGQLAEQWSWPATGARGARVSEERTTPGNYL